MASVTKFEGFADASEMVRADEVPVGVLVYVPDVYPQKLWGRVAAVMPDADRPGYLCVDLDGAPPDFGLALKAYFKPNHVVKVRRPVAAPAS